MDKMIVGINYTQSGERVIGKLYYLCDTVSDVTFSQIVDAQKYCFDEVYIVDFNPNCVDFINEIVLKGCKV